MTRAGGQPAADKSPRARVEPVTDRHRAAHACLVAVAAHLSTQIVEDANFTTWRGVLADLLDDCNNCPEPLIAVREMARELVAAKGAEIGRAKALLRLTVADHYAQAAADRLEAWRRAWGWS